MEVSISDDSVGENEANGNMSGDTTPELVNQNHTNGTNDKDLAENGIYVNNIQTAGILPIRDQLLTIHAESDHSGLVDISGKQSFIVMDTELNCSRSPLNHVFSSVFSLGVKQLYCYRPYFGLLNKNHAVCCNCMLECGNILVMLLETRSQQPHYHAAIYYTNSKTCEIVKRDSRWALKNFVLRPDLPLTVLVEELEA